MKLERQAVSAGRYALFLFLAGIGCAADLYTKHWVFSQPQLLGGRNAIWWFWDGHVGIQQALNEGAVWGVGKGHTWFFACVSFVFVVAIPVWLFVFGAASSRFLTIALGCILGGVLGNLYDRLGLHGLVWDPFQVDRVGEKVYAVRDWILVAWDFEGGGIWPNFNIADSLLVCGAISLFVHAMIADRCGKPA